MYALSTEHHTQTNSADKATNIAQHLAEHRLYGQAVIVADDPQAMLRQVQRAWRRVGRYTWLCSFAAAPPGDDVYAQVLIATPAQCLRYPPLCATMYITCEIDRTDLHMMTSWMPRYGTVVFYPGVLA